MIDLIAIHAKLGVGKDTLASFLTDHTPYSFADPLRKGLLALDPYVKFSFVQGPHDRLSSVVAERGWDEAKKIPEVRRLMQVYGTEAGRDIHGQDCWLNIAERFVDSHEKVVIRDVRFNNEMDAIYSWEFNKPKLKDRVATVKMDGESRREHEQNATKHVSEQGLEDWLFDYLVFNDGTLDDLRWAACYIVERKPPKRQLKLICHSRTVTGVTE
jgi:hypothetical protein